MSHYRSEIVILKSKRTGNNYAVYEFESDKVKKISTLTWVTKNIIDKLEEGTKIPANIEIVTSTGKSSQSNDSNNHRGGFNNNKQFDGNSFPMNSCEIHEAGTKFVKLTFKHNDSLVETCPKDVKEMVGVILRSHPEIEDNK